MRVFRIIGLRNFLKKNCAFMLLSFFLPLIIMAFAYLTIGIYFGSPRSVLASDSLSQYSNFLASFNNLLHGSGNLFYSWNGSLGSNYLSLSGYYLGGIFTPLVYFFSNKNIPDAYYLITLLTIGASGLSMWLMCRQLFKSLNAYAHLVLAIPYALMSFFIVQSELITWLNSAVWLPLIVLGIHRLLERKGNTLLFVSYLLAFTMNFYFGYIIGLYSFLFFATLVLINRKGYLKRVFTYIRVSVLALLSSLIVTLPVYLDIRANGEAIVGPSALLNNGLSVLGLVYKNFIASYDTTKFGSFPYVYVGLFPLLFAMIYFITGASSRRQKLFFGLLLFVIVLSFYFQAPSLFWQGFHWPIMFIFRYAWTFSFTVVYLAGFGLEYFYTKRQELPRRRIILSIILVILIFLLAYFLRGSHNRYINQNSLTDTLGILAIYLAAIGLWIYRKLATKTFFIIILLTVCTEAFLNSSDMLTGILSEWNYANRSVYSVPHDAIQTLVNKTKAENTQPYRLENLDPILGSANDSFNFNYSGISMFSSVRNRHSSEFLRNIGFNSPGTNVNIRYLGNTLLADSFTGIKYNISQNPVDKYGFNFDGRSGNYQLYQNAAALPLGFMVSMSAYAYKAKVKDNLASQTDLFDTLSGLNKSYFNFVVPQLLTETNASLSTTTKSVVVQPKDNSKNVYLNYSVTVPQTSQAMVSIFVESKYAESIELIQNGKTIKYQPAVDGQYYNLGYVKAGQSINYQIVFLAGGGKVTIASPLVLLTNTGNFQQAFDTINSYGAAVSISANTVDFEVRSSYKHDVLYTTIPYDAGWSATLDGKPVKISEMDGAFLSVKIPSTGKHELHFSFVPPGLYIGIVSFVSGVTLFIVIESRAIRKIIIAKKYHKNLSRTST